MPLTRDSDMVLWSVESNRFMKAFQLSPRHVVRVNSFLLKELHSGHFDGSILHSHQRRVARVVIRERADLEEHVTEQSCFSNSMWSDDNKGLLPRAKSEYSAYATERRGLQHTFYP